MSEYEKMTESESYRARANSREGRELSAEQKEKAVEQAEKKLAAKERAEVVSKEIKTTKNQIQHIVANMSQVIKAVAAIRAQLGVTTTGGIPSVDRDEKILEELKKKLAGLMGEIKDLKVALLAEEIKSVKEELPDWNDAAVFAEAEQRANRILEILDINHL